MRYLTIAALAVALMIPNAASAQRGHGGGGGHGGGTGGGGGGGHPGGGGGGGVWHGGGGSWGGGGHWDGGHGGGNWGHGNYWYPGVAFGLGYGLGAYSYGWPYSSYYSYDYPSNYSYPSYGYADTYPRVSSYYAPMADSSYSMMSRARLDIQVPDPNADLLIQGQRVNAMGNQRMFVSPDLESGKTYTYTITFRSNASGQLQDDTRQIDVRAGSSARVDFTRPQINTMPTPRPVGERLPPQVSPPK